MKIEVYYKMEFDKYFKQTEQLNLYSLLLFKG
jgi:hypothetical protein